MAEITLTQSEADVLISMEKHKVNDDWHALPLLGGKTAIPLQSSDRREQFLLDIYQGRIDLLKAKFQDRARQIVVLIRLDLGGPPHCNPDGEEISCPHLHVYREGYGDKWAIPAPIDCFQQISDLWVTLGDFMRYCNVSQPPNIQRGIFV